MPRLWRLTRNRYGRAVYDALARVGITATVMYEYVAALENAAVADDREDRAGRDDVAYTVEICDPVRVAPLGAPVDELESDEHVVVALEDGRPRGYCFLSIDATHEIHPLERTVAFDGAYVRRVFVDPDHRNRGIATALIDETRRIARERGAERATALVALDNYPSRALFERHGFEPRRKHQYVRVGPFSHRTVRSA